MKLIISPKNGAKEREGRGRYFYWKMAAMRQFDILVPWKIYYFHEFYLLIKISDWNSMTSIDFFLFDIFFDIVIDMFTSISLFVSELYNIHFSLCRFFLLNFFVYLCKYNVFTDRKFRRNQLSSTNQSYIPHKILVTYKENIWIKISNYINPNFSTISNPKLCINYLLNNSSPKQLTPVIALPSIVSTTISISP